MTTAPSMERSGRSAEASCTDEGSEACSAGTGSVSGNSSVLILPRDDLPMLYGLVPHQPKTFG
jgi:hypothetical protein